MDESEDNMSIDSLRTESSPLTIKTKPKKRSLVERELETNLTARVTSPITNSDGTTSRYGRARRLKADSEVSDTEVVVRSVKTPVLDKTPTKIQSPVYKMHASNSPIKLEPSKSAPKRISIETNLDNQIENIYHENILLSRFGSEEKKSVSPINKAPKVYVRKDLIQKRDDDDDDDAITLIKNIFSPVKSTSKSNSHLRNILERSSEKYGLNSTAKSQGYASVVKTLDFDNKKKRKEARDVKTVLSKSEVFDLEARCEYQVGDLAWARMGTYPFWPCIITRDPFSGMFVKKKLFGRIERDVMHVTFFGDNGRRSWIVDSMLRKFLGQLEFEATREQFSPSAKKRDPRFYSAFFISEKKLPQWNKSVEEAEILLREPKRLRIDLLNDMLVKERAAKCTSKHNRSGKITRTDSDVSLSESLYDTLFSEDDGKTEDSDRSRNKSRNKSLDVSEVVTACLDNMAAKTGITKIQRQSHMDRWLQKAKSKTPEKSQAKVHVTQKESKSAILSSLRNNSIANKKKKPVLKPIIIQKPYKLRKSNNQAQNLLSHENEQDSSTEFNTSSGLEHKENGKNFEHKINDSIEHSVIAEVESSSDIAQDNDKNDNESNALKSIQCNINTNLKNEDMENYDTSSNTENVFEDIKFSVDNIEVNKYNLNDSETNSSLQENSQDNISNVQNDSEVSNIQLKNEEVLQEDRIIDYLETEENENSYGIKTSNRDDNQLHITDIENSYEDSQENISNPKDSETNPNQSNDKMNELMTKGLKESLNNISFSEIQSNSITEDGVNEESMNAIETESTDEINLNVKPIDNSKEIDNENLNILIHEKLDTKLNTVTSIDLCLPHLMQNGDINCKSLNAEDKSSKYLDDAELESRNGDVLDIFEQVISDNQEVPEFSDNCKKNVSMKEPVKELDITNINEKDMSNQNSNYLYNIQLESHNIDADVSKKVSCDNETCTDSTESGTKHVIINGIDKEIDFNVVKNHIKSQNIKCLFGNELESHNIESSEAFEKQSCNDQNVLDGGMNNRNKFDVTEQKQALKDNVTNITNTMEINDSSFEFTERYETVNLKTDINERDLNSDMEISIYENKVQTNLKIHVSNNLQNECCPFNSSIEIVRSFRPTNKDFEAEDVKLKGSKHLTSEDYKDIHDIEKQGDNMGNVSSVNDFNESVNKNNNVTKVENDLIKNLMCLNQLCSSNIQLDTIENHNLNNDLECVVQVNNDEVFNNDSSLEITDSDSVKMNGFHHSTFQDYLDAETSSLNSEDSEPLSITRLKLKNLKDTNKLLNPDFVQYLDMKLDDLIEEHPNQTRDEIVEYLYKTWEYEQNTKSDFRKNDEIKQLSMIKGLTNQDAVRKKHDQNFKLEAGKNEDIKQSYMSDELTHYNGNRKKSVKDNVRNEKVVKNKTLIKEQAKNKHRLSLKRWLIPQTSEMPEVKKDKDITEIKNKVNENTGLDFIKVPVENMSQQHFESFTIQHLNTESSPHIAEAMKLDNTEIKLELENQPKDDNEIEAIALCSLQKKLSENLVKQINSAQFLNDKHNDEKYNVKVEFDSENISIHSEESDASVSKRKRLKPGEKSVCNLDDPEFVKYLELRQDTLIDENPQLTQAEIKSYLYKTWLYEESVKSEIKKNDEITQSNLVKGLQQDAPVKKIRKKVKAEKELLVDNIVMKDKPKRKTSQPYYNEEISDIEDDLEMFEIGNNTINEISNLDKLQVGRKTNEVIELYEEEIDEVELYFEDLTRPKPNIFKGLIREKVCNICEKTDNLIKCKGCSNMFHFDCDKKESEKVIEVSIPSRGRKKKKKIGRKSKNLEDSGSHSDERSQDISDEHMSIDDIVEPVPRVVDADSFEAQLADKMKELLDSYNLEYESYSSDDGINWDNCIAGKCEIVDVKLKPKKESNDYSDFKCKNCQKYDIPVCFVCKQATSKSGLVYRQKCQVAHCCKYYHIECLDHWPQTQFSSGEISRNKKKNEHVEALTCPRHVCHTCVSDDPRGCKTRFSGDKLARCVRCPATYHTFTKCLPAGSQILTGSLIICPRHYEHRPGKVPCHVNTGWCFICALGGTLICCEYCPTSFHAECLNIKPPEGGYMCEDCETGRLPLYGEMVWVKLGHYRWWPGIILHPSEIPSNIMAVKHSPGEFVVRFFGQYDYYWVNRGRVFPFQEGDSGKVSSQKSKIDAAFTTAMEHAQRACGVLKAAQPNEEESLDIASSLLPPHYVKLKVNKPCGSLCGKRIDIEESSLTQCDCNPDEEDPCGPYSQCLNRMLLTECGPICRAGDRCNNRAFEKRLYPKLVPYRTPQRGWGLKTLEEIRAGQFVIEYVGELIDEDEFKRRMNRKHEIRDENFYFLTLDKERMIDAGPKGNLARFMNHCCEPNCETQKWTVLGDVRVGLFAIDDIPANSEVTFNYNLECAGIDKKRCLCGAKRCSGYIGAKPKQTETQQKKPKVAAKRTYKKRKQEGSPSTKAKPKPKRSVGRPTKPRELTEIEKDLLIIKSATNGLSSDSDCSRLSSLEGDRSQKAQKRKRVSFSTEDVILNGKNSPCVKKMKMDDYKSSELD
ncbi:uncharacterized protein LOC131845484 [Achroia grisella]|uniref:uncharacterized protein LOC131845484 n=1 Tax=Achroia grisella TaxID=688607 RepID=UPI0027D2CBF6|nr:uncharacterized protein LOC131845484 [Achroia grisella]